MAAIQVGRECAKLKGGDSGDKVVITKVIDYSSRDGPLAREASGHRSAVAHLSPMQMAAERFLVFAPFLQFFSL